MDVQVNRLVKSFGKTRAVDELSFALSSGQIYAFVGPNGAGKTTTMRIMSTLETPDHGDVLFDGMSAPQYPEEARRLFGYMPDALPEHRDIVVHEYIDFFARAFGLRRHVRRKTIAALEEFVGLQNMRDKQLRALSKGMKQRVSLARALVHDPPLLILDEPAAGLDPRARIELRELVVALAERGKAILISSHILNELEAIAHGAVIIERGRLIRAGSMDELHRFPFNDDAATPIRHVSIRVIGDENHAVRVLLEQPHVLTARRVRHTIEAEIDGDDHDAATLLASLINAGLRVVEYRPTKSGLEQLFMGVTKGEVQ